MKLSANDVRAIVDRAYQSVSQILPIPSTEYGSRTGDWGQDEDWCIWVGGFGIRPTLIATDTIAGRRHYSGYEVVRSLPVTPSPCDLDQYPEPVVEPVESFEGVERAIGYMVGLAVADWTTARLLRPLPEDPYDDIPSFLKRQAD